MPLEARDAAYLWDIIEAARSIREFTAEVTVQQYLADISGDVRQQELERDHPT